MKLVFVVIIGLFTVGCSTKSPKCDVPQVGAGQGATVIIYRPYNSFSMLYSTPFAIDNCSIGSLSNNSYKVFSLPPGTHKIAAERYVFAVGGDGEVTGEFRAGETYYIHYEMKPGGYVVHSPRVSFSVSTHLFVAEKEFALKIKPDLPNL